MSHNPRAEYTEETAHMMQLRKAREDSNWVDHPHVDYTDLEHFIGNCRRLKDEESFNTAIRILQAIKKQVVGK